MQSNLLGNRHIRQEHKLGRIYIRGKQGEKKSSPYLFNQVVSFGCIVRITVYRHPVFTQIEQETGRMQREGAVLKPTSTQVPRKTLMEYQIFQLCQKGGCTVRSFRSCSISDGSQTGIIGTPPRGLPSITS